MNEVSGQDGLYKVQDHPRLSGIIWQRRSLEQDDDEWAFTSMTTIHCTVGFRRRNGATGFGATGLTINWGWLPKPGLLGRSTPSLKR